MFLVKQWGNRRRKANDVGIARRYYFTKPRDVISKLLAIRRKREAHHGGYFLLSYSLRQDKNKIRCATTNGALTVHKSCVSFLLSTKKSNGCLRESCKPGLELYAV